MPIYEYRCHDCRRRVSLFYRSYSAIEDEPTCPRCGGNSLSRLISRVAVVRSEDSRMDDLADPSMLGDLDEDDPKSLGRWMRKMSAEAGEDMPQEFDEVIDRLESGQTPEQIEESMPELGDSLGGGMDGGLGGGLDGGLGGLV
jgi:putative FmdB family regulatory protein